MPYTTGRYGAGHTNSRSRRTVPRQRGTVIITAETRAWHALVDEATKISWRLRETVVAMRQEGAPLSTVEKLVFGESKWRDWKEAQADRLDYARGQY